MEDQRPNICGIEISSQPCFLVPPSLPTSTTPESLWWICVRYDGKLVTYKLNAWLNSLFLFLNIRPHANVCTPHSPFVVYIKKCPQSFVTGTCSSFMSPTWISRSIRAPLMILVSGFCTSPHFPFPAPLLHCSPKTLQLKEASVGFATVRSVMLQYEKGSSSYFSATSAPGAPAHHLQTLIALCDLTPPPVLYQWQLKAQKLWDAGVRPSKDMMNELQTYWHSFVYSSHYRS